MKPNIKHLNPVRSRFGHRAGRVGILSALLSCSSLQVFGQAFSPGNLVVVQAGDGVQSLSSAGNEVSLVQLNPSGAVVGTPFALPTNGPSALLQNGTSITEGFVNLTPGGQALVLAGYNVRYGYTNASVSSASAASVPRAVATVDVNGNYTLVTNSVTLYSGANIRSAAGDGNFNFWAEGSSGGLAYLGTGPQTALTGTVLNSRVIQLIGGNLYYGTGSDKRAIVMINGTPTSGGATTNYVIPVGATFTSSSPTTSPSSPYAFIFDPAMTVCYVADSNNYTNSGTLGGVEKWTNNGAGVFGFAYTLRPGPAGNVSGAVGLTASFGGATNLYGTLANNTNVFAITDTGPSSAGTVIYSCLVNQAVRGICFAPTNSLTPAAPVISSLNPASQTVYVGATAALSVIANVGSPAASNLWYFVANSATNFIPGATGTTLTLTNLQSTNSGRYFVVLTNASGSVTSKPVALSVVSPYPVISGISPTNVTVNAGQTVVFTLTGSFGTPPASNFWYQVTGSATNWVPGLPGTALTLTNVVAAQAGNYFAILTNVYGSATSSVVSLAVIEPVIQVEPASAEGLLKGTIQFAVTAAGTAPLAYQWYYSDGNGNLLGPVNNGNSTPSGMAAVSGAGSNLLTIANLQNADVTSLTNLVVVVTNVYGAITSSVAGLLAGTNAPGVLPVTGGVLALWDFDGSQFIDYTTNPNCINSPAPLIGSGAALPVGSTFNPPAVISPSTISSTSYSPFSGATDPSDVGFDAVQNAYVFTPYGFEQPSPNYSWGTDNYPAVTGTNKANGVQFNVSTAGARNIRVSYDARVSGTGSDYHRLQYTTNRTAWVDYPSSACFDGLYGSGNAGYYTFSYDLTGFPGVDNNPDFGVRIVTEWQSTATYQTPGPTAGNTNTVGANGVIATNFWVGTANVYTSGASGNAAAGTFTFDLVAVRGDALTNNNPPPVLSLANLPATNGLSYTNMVDTNTLVLNFTASSAQMPAADLTFSVRPVNTVSAGPFAQTVNPSFSVVNTGSTNFQLNLSFSGSFIPDAVDAAPILVTATDTNGQSTAAWFLLTVSSINQPPTNTLTALRSTNLLVNTAVTIPFVSGSARSPYSSLSYSVASDNNTVIPAANIVIGGDPSTGNPTVTVTPATGQVGNALISVAVNDNDPVEPRSTTANLAVVVRPNTNVVAVDFFNYDQSGALDTIAAGYWQHLSGINTQLKANSAPVGGTATISGGNTENIQAQLVNNPYKTNSGAILYSSFTVNVPADGLAVNNGTYITAFNDGSGNTSEVEDCLVVATNGAAPGFYRLGIGNTVGATALTARMFPQDLTPGTPYFVVTALSLTNGNSTLWVSPTNQFSAQVTDTTPPSNPTNLYNIVNFELRESGANEGTVYLGAVLVGLSFDSVFYPAQANPDFVGVTENTTNLLSPLWNDAGWGLMLTNLAPDGNETVAISGTNISFLPTNNFIGTAVVGYSIQDSLGNISNATFTVVVTNDPPAANPATFTVVENSSNNLLNALAADWLNTPGGALSLVSAGPASSGAAMISGTNIVFTPAGNFTGAVTIPYLITDNIGGTNGSVVTVMVANLAPIPLSATLANNHSNLVLTWTNAAFGLQSATNVAGPYVTIPGARSPYTNLTTTNAAGYFRLAH